MTLLLLAAAILATPTLSETVSLECAATRVEQVLKDLEPKTGLNLRCVALFRDTPLVISARDVSARDLLDHIAQSVGGAWRTKDGVEELFQPPEIAKKEREASFAAQLEQVKSAIADTFKEDPGPMSESELEAYYRTLLVLASGLKEDQQNRGLREAYEAQSARSPYGRALSRLVKSIPPEEIVRGGSRIVFAIKPTPRQRPFGPGASKVLQDLQREQDRWARTLAKLDPKRDQRPNAGMPGNALWQENPPDAGSTLRLVVGKRIPGTLVFDLVEAVDGSPALGQVRLQRMARSDALKTLYDRMLAPAVEGEPVPFGPLSREFADTVREMGYQGTEFLSPALQAFLLDPVTRDPLSLAASDCLLELARQRNTPLVAWPTEELTVVGGAVNEVTIKQFVAMSQGPTGGLEYKEAGGWMVARPIDPVTAREEHLDRTALRRFARAIKQKGGVRLPDFAELAASSNSPRANQMAVLWLLLHDRMSSSLLGQTQWDTAKLYGSLSENVRRSLEEGGTVRFDQLSTTQKVRLESLAFSKTILKIARGPFGQQRAFESILEPTVVLASGIPGETELALDVRAVALPYAYRRLGNGKVEPFSASGVGSIASLERNGAADQGLAGYAMGTQRTTSVRIVYGVDIEQGFGMGTNEVDAHARPIPWTELPAPFPEQVRDYLKNMQPPPGRQGQPPPVARSR